MRVVINVIKIKKNLQKNYSRCLLQNIKIFVKFGEVILCQNVEYFANTVTMTTFKFNCGNRQKFISVLLVRKKLFEQNLILGLYSLQAI